MSLETPSTGVAARLAPRDPATHLRLAAPADEPFLRDLYKSSRAGEFAATGLPPAAIEPLLDQQYRAQAAGYAAQFPGAVALIILYRDAPVGRLILEAADLSWRIVDLALLDAMRGQGIGSDIIEAVGRAASTHGARELCLAVLSGNAAARRLYERLGFAISGDDGVRIAMVRPLP
ncbi:N-acetyltransferase family protein [Bradyrhizobium genosp. P]|uniref:GNAT family N-acetyltransferase n=1 Tax=Bradyrhizobium genosp. P TaxID=83641 RepID=UPI003CEC7B67